MIDLVLSLVLPASLLRAVLISIIVFLLTRLYLTKSRCSLPLPPGPYGIPFLGWLPFVGQDFHIKLFNLSKKYGKIFQIHLGNKRVVIISDVKLIKEAFKQPVFSGRPDTELTRILQGYGKLVSISNTNLSKHILLQALSTPMELCGRSKEPFSIPFCVNWVPKV